MRHRGSYRYTGNIGTDRGGIIGRIGMERRIKYNVVRAVRQSQTGKRLVRVNDGISSLGHRTDQIVLHRNGLESGGFVDSDSCTIWRAAGSPHPQNTVNPFGDVNEDSYYYEAVLWAMENGITTGTSANSFSPDVSCTRGQVVTFLYRYHGMQATEGTYFSDVREDSYYYDAVQWAAQNEITAGTSASTFSPNADCTRAQIVTFLYRDFKE